ncbi:neuronal acetylcholine receptor subunit alpha-5-like isoform X2 [Ruditapes philippinarum]|uniref:neuronal acetylcholine receptor subunit alpha-5-like isoform X2 n=1 Tax=Ruditapes philippinarum TaxID=129788 RepID=UPI00295BBC64|nr:neuronal acetylcholine receptor subunit alpha-5-like isoform X2 [Ruditapes philippinarum]
MKTNGILLCVSVLAVFIVRTFAQSRGDQENDNAKYIDEAVQIVSTVFHKYKPEVPPRKHYPDPVVLSVNLNVLHISSLDIVAQTLESTVELEVNWNDTRLSWYPLVVKEITVDEKKIWTPSLHISNVAGEQKEVDSPKFVIKSNGRIYMHRRLQVKTFCETDLTASVVDCDIILGSNLLNEKIINFDMNNSACLLSRTAHSIQASIGEPNLRLVELPMLKADATFPEFVCSLNIEDSKCCKGNTKGMFSSNNNAAAGIPLIPYIFILTVLLLFIS